MKKYNIYIFILLSIFASATIEIRAAVSSSQILEGSQELECNEYYNGGKVIEETIYVPDAGSGKSTSVTLYTHSGSNQFRPIIKWITPTDSTVSSINSCSSTTCSPARKTISVQGGYSDFSVYAVTYANTSNTIKIDNVAYTKKFNIKHPVNFVYDESKNKHTLVAEEGAEIHLVPDDIHIGNYFFDDVQATCLKFKLPNGNIVAANYGHYSNNGSTENGDYPFDYAYKTTAPTDGSTQTYECYAYKGNTSLGLVAKWLVKAQEMPAYDYVTDTIYYNGFDGYTTETGITTAGFGKNSITGEWTTDFGRTNKIVNTNPIRSEYGIYNGNLKTISAWKNYAVYTDIVSLPDRLFHFVVEDTHGNDSLFISGLFRSRDASADLCNLKFVVYDYTSNQKGDEIITYNTGEIIIGSGNNGYSKYGVAMKVPVGCSKLLVEIINNSFSQSGNNDLYYDELSVIRIGDIPKDGIYRIINSKTKQYLTNNGTSTKKTNGTDGSTIWYVKTNQKNKTCSFLNLSSATTAVEYLTVEEENVTFSSTENMLTSVFLVKHTTIGDNYTLPINDANGTIIKVPGNWIFVPVSLLVYPDELQIQSGNTETQVPIHAEHLEAVTDVTITAATDVTISGELVTSLNASIVSDNSNVYIKIPNSEQKGTYSYNLKNVKYSKGGLVPDKYIVTTNKLDVIDKFDDGIYQIENELTGRYLQNSSTQTTPTLKKNGTTLWYLEYYNNSEFYLLNLDTTTNKVEYLYTDGDEIKLDSEKHPISIKVLGTNPIRFSMGIEDNVGSIYSFGTMETGTGEKDVWYANPVSLKQYTTTYKMYAYSSNRTESISILSENNNVGIGKPSDIKLEFEQKESWVNSEIKKNDISSYIELSNLKGFCFLKYYLINDAYAKGGRVPLTYRKSKLLNTVISLNMSSGDWFNIKFINSDLFIDAGLDEDDNIIVTEGPINLTERTTQAWQLKYLDQKNYYVVVNANGLVVTATDNDEIVLTKYEEGNNYQIWKATLSDKELEPGYMLTSLATNKAITDGGDRLVLEDASASYNEDQRIVANIDDYYYTIRIPEGNDGLTINFQNTYDINKITFWAEDNTQNLTKNNFSYVITEDLLSESNGVISIPDQNFISQLLEGEYRFKLEVETNDESTCSNTYDIILHVIPSKLKWTGADGSDAENWNNPLNWISSSSDRKEIPITISYIEIPKGLNAYPVLKDTTEYMVSSNIPFRDQNFDYHPSADSILVEHGGEIAHTEYLNYTRILYRLDGLETNRWYSMSTPLKNVYSGDFTFRNVNPLIEMREHNVSHPDTDEKLDGIDWNSSFKSATESVSGIGFAMKIGSIFYNGMTWASDSSLDYTKKGTIQIINNMNDYDLSLSFPRYNSSFQFYNNITKHPSSTVQTLDEDGRINAGKLVYEQDANANSIERDSVLFEFIIPYNVNNVGDFILLPNPFISHIDFAAFYEANKDLIKNEYKLLTGYDQAYVSYSGNNGVYTSSNGDTNPSYAKIAPYQSFIVTTTQKDSRGCSLKYSANISVTDAEAVRLRSSQNVGKHILFSAKNDKNVTKALLLFDEESSTGYSQEEDSKRLFAVGSNAPSIAIGIDSFYLDISREPNLREKTPLALMALEKGEIEVGIKNVVSSVDEGETVYFVDTKNSVMEEITNDDYAYTFTSDGTTQLNRFYLMRAKGISTDVFDNNSNNDEENSITVYRNGAKAFIIAKNESIRNVRVNLMNGELFYSSDYKNENMISVPIPSETMVVLITVTTDLQTKTVKFRTK